MMPPTRTCPGRAPRCRVLHGILAAVLLLAGVAPSLAQGYPNRPVRVVVGFPRRRPDRRHRAPRGATAFRQSRPAVLCREHRRRGRQHRVRSGRARDSRRLYHHGDQHGLHGEPQPLRQGAVRSDQGFLRGDAGCGFAERRGGQPAGPGQNAAGACAADPGQSRQIQLCRPRRGFDAASRRRAVSPDLQARPRPRPLHRRGARRAVNRRRPHPHRLHRVAVLDCGDPGRSGARDRHCGDGARASKCPTCRPSPNRA